MSASSPALQSWQTAFDAQQDRSADQQRAFTDFLARGLPTTKLDTWKYTDLRRLAMRQFQLGTGSIATPDAEALLLPLKNCRPLLFVDGALQRNQQALIKENVVVRADAFDLLNAAFSKNTTHIEIDGQSAQPIYIAYVWTQNANALMTHPRVRVTLADNSKATLIEHHVGLNENANFTNAILDIDVREHAALEHVRVQDDAPANFNIGSIWATVARGASYINHHYVSGGGLARTDINVRLVGEDAQTELHGLIFARHTQHLDVRTCIDHQAPNTRSREDYRGIADDRGRVVFNGKVIVAKDAQRTDAAQSSRNLLLSPHAEIDTRPELEIYANDVKCAHGATVGQLDAAALFYLRSRGIDRDEARALLTQAFAAEVIERVPVPAVREHMMAQFLKRMRAGSAQ
ncbi:MAG TPA: Fe-S cluster assembly protein SufD [Steroidobacteraceae bacterium]|nr:Fe-S cluster assembly protein SufD [Steroidobacteraceae bacterium]